VSSISNVKEFLPSLTKSEVEVPAPPPSSNGDIIFSSDAKSVTFLLGFPTPRSEPTVTNGTIVSFTDVTSQFPVVNTYVYQLVIDNPLKDCNISNIVNLTVLVCGSNQLKTLDVSKLVNLTVLVCGSNQLKTLDVSKLVNLTGLGCGGNQLTTLDVSKLVNLTVLVCGSNQLKTLDVSKLVNLTGLDCRSNDITKVEANNILDDLRNITDGRGECFIKDQTGVTLDGLIDISGKGWDVY